MNVRALIVAVFLPAAAFAQGFAGLGADADGFAKPQRGTVLTFPRDHGAHPDYRIEWWYLTANLTDADGRPYGLQWTLFRTGFAPPADDPAGDAQLWMGHVAVTSETAHFASERLARTGGRAGVVTEPFAAWIDDWRLEGDWQTMKMTTNTPDFGYTMDLTANGPLVLHGDNGYSRKSASGTASYYYSQPFFDIAGTLHLPDGDVMVTGSAWFDQEWSSQPLDADQRGWDWFSLSFDDGAKLMGFRLHQSDDNYFTAATWIAPDGIATAFPDGVFQARPLAYNSADVPVHWQVTLPDRGVDVTVEALNDSSWMALSVPYWEGPVTFTGSHNGRGYLEMTGYD